MTDPLEGVTDAHLQAALDAVGLSHIEARHIRTGEGDWRNTIAHARTIAANEKLAAELAEMRAKYEPAPVDPVEAEIEALIEEWRRGPMAPEIIRKAFLRGMEMQPAPSRANDAALFTREQAERIMQVLPGDWVSCVLTALTTPRADLLAMLGDG